VFDHYVQFFNFVRATAPPNTVPPVLSTGDIHFERVDLRTHCVHGAARQRLHDRRVVAQPDGCGPNAGAGQLVERPSPQVVHPGASFERERTLHHALRRHLTREKGHPGARLGHPHRHRQRERGLSAPDVAAEHDQIAPPDPPAEPTVDAREPGTHRVGRGRPVRRKVHPTHDAGDRGDVGGTQSNPY
jgi:hypothetical protein